MEGEHDDKLERPFEGMTTVSSVTCAIFSWESGQRRHNSSADTAYVVGISSSSTHQLFANNSCPHALIDEVAFHTRLLCGNGCVATYRAIGTCDEFCFITTIRKIFSPSFIDISDYVNAFFRGTSLTTPTDSASKIYGTPYTRCVGAICAGRRWTVAVAAPWCPLVLSHVYYL